jgi:hypothetical protein
MKEQTIFNFGIFLIDEYRYAHFEEWNMLLKQLEITSVPILADNYLLEKDIPSIIAKAGRKSMFNREAIAEGIVIRLKTSKEHTSFKAINNDFLLKHGE